MNSINYPFTQKDDKAIDTYHGVEIADPYRWLEDLSSSNVNEFVTAQNNLTNSYLQSCDAREKIQTAISNLCDFTEYECPFRRGEYYFYFRDSILYLTSSLNDCGNARVILDPSSESILSGSHNPTISSSIFEKTGEVYGNHLCSVSSDGNVLAFGISECGSTWNTIYFKNIDTGEYYLDKLEYVQDTYLSWTSDNKGLFYGRYPDKTYENESIYYHILGMDQSSDKLILQFPSNPKWELKPKVSDCGEYLIIYVLEDCGGNTMVYIGNIKELLSIKEQESSSAMIPLVSSFGGDYDYITNSESMFYFLTNKDAPNSTIIGVDLSSQMSMPERKVINIVKEHPKDVLEWAICVNQKYLLTCYMRDVTSILRLRFLNNGVVIHTFILEIGSIIGHCGRREDTEVFFKFTSFLTPGIIYRFNLSELDNIPSCSCSCKNFTKHRFKLQVFKESKIEMFDPSYMNIKQLFYKSKDKTIVSMFLIHQKTLVKNRKNICVLHGYGGFNWSFRPAYDPLYVAFVKHFSGIIAIANIRGGGEYGRHWHEDGIRLKKQNSFNDFISAAEYLIDKKYTSHKDLFIRGDSNGGLVVGACVNQRPELFGGAIMGYGVMDLLRFHKFTTGSCWISDYGCSENMADFCNLVQISPLHNVRKNVLYPPMLLITADHDERVLPLHSYKMIAELQEKIGKNPNQKNPLLLRIETNVGHGDGMSLDVSIDEITDILSFIMLTTGIEFKE